MIGLNDVRPYAEEYEIDAGLILAIILTESSGNSWAIRYEPEWRFFNEPAHWASTLKISPETEQHLQMFSWGLMQIMGATARDMGFTKELQKLCAPNLGIEYGCKYLRRQLLRYSGQTISAIAAYNAGSAIRSDVDKTKYVNQVYVDKVMNEWSKLGKKT